MRDDIFIKVALCIYVYIFFVCKERWKRKDDLRRVSLENPKRFIIR